MLIKQSAGRNIGGVYLKIRLLIQFCLQRNFFCFNCNKSFWSRRNMFDSLLKIFDVIENGRNNGCTKWVIPYLG